MSSRKKSRIEELSKGRANIHKIDINEIIFIWEDNVRTDYGDIESLARSIADIGVRQPLKVYFKGDEPKPYASDGFRRRKAVEYAREQGWLNPDEPVIVHVMLESQHAGLSDFIFTQLVANSGKGLTPLEKATNIRRLIDRNHTLEEIATRACISKTHAEKLLALSYATPSTKQLIERKEVKPTIVSATISKYGPDEAETFLSEAVREAQKTSQKATARFVEDYIAKKTGETPQEQSSFTAISGQLELQKPDEHKPTEPPGTKEATPSNKRAKDSGQQQTDTDEPKQVKKLNEDERQQYIDRISRSDLKQLEDKDLIKLNSMLDDLQIPIM